MSCQGNFLSGAKSAAQNGVSKIASMSAAAGGRAGAAFSAGKDKAQSAFSAAGARVVAGRDKAQSVVSAGKDKAQSVVSAGKDKAQSAISAAGDKVAPITQNKVFRNFTRGPRAYLGFQKSYAQGHLRIAKAVNGFMKDMKSADAAFGENTSGIRQKRLEALGEYKKQETIGTVGMKQGLTANMVAGGLAGGFMGGLLGAATGLPGMASVGAGIVGSDYALEAGQIDRQLKWLKTPEGKAADAQLDQANEDYRTALKPHEKERAQATKSAAKKLFSEVRGAQGDIIGGYTGSWRTLLGR